MVIVAQLGARRHYAVPRALHEEGLLTTLFTDACAEFMPWSAFRRLVPRTFQPRALRSIVDRRIDGVDKSRLSGLLSTFLSSRIGAKRARDGEHRAEFWVRQNKAFGRAVASRNWGDADTIYGFNGAALEIFEEAKKRGIRCVLDQTAAPWKFNTRLLQGEMEKWPGWECDPIDIDPNGVMTGREEREWELADRVICGSEFVIEAAKEVGAPIEKFKVVRYPTPIPPADAASRLHPRAPGGDLRVLFLGTVQLRKGVQYLVQAAQQKRCRLSVRVVGPLAVTKKAAAVISEVADLTGPVSRSEVWEHYRWADVFVLPTLSEGSANVCHEAAAMGVPVITTKAAGIRESDGVTLVNSPERIGEALAEIAQSGSNWQSPALRTAPASWDYYRKELVQSL